MMYMCLVPSKNTIHLHFFTIYHPSSQNTFHNTIYNIFLHLHFYHQTKHTLDLFLSQRKEMRRWISEISQSVFIHTFKQNQANFFLKDSCIISNRGRTLLYSLPLVTCLNKMEKLQSQSNCKSEGQIFQVPKNWQIN